MMSRKRTRAEKETGLGRKGRRRRVSLGDGSTSSVGKGTNNRRTEGQELLCNVDQSTQVSKISLTKSRWFS